MNNRQHIQKKHPSQSTYTPVQNLYQTRAFDIQLDQSHSSSGQENVDLDADHEQSQYNRYNLPYIPVNAPGTEPPPPIQTQLNSGEPTNYYQQGSADVAWYNRPTYPNIPVNAPGTEPPPPIQTQLNSGEPTNYYQQGSADVAWYNRPTYPNIPVNAPGTEPPPPIQTQLNSGEPTNYYQQGSADVAWYNRPTYPNIPVNAPGTEPPPPIQTQLNSGEPTNYYQQGSADVPWYNRPTYPNIPVNAPATEPPPPIQTKLTIGQPGDKYEQEADQVASQVVQQINSPVPVQSAQGQTVQREEVPEEEEQVQAKSISNTIQREEVAPFEEEPIQAKSISDTIQREELPEEEEQLQAKSISDTIQREELPEEEQLQGKSLKGEIAATPNLETSIQGARGSGQPLDENIRQPMEKAFGGVDFSQVKVHNDAVSDQLNQSIQARAFTTGQDLFFRGGEYNPSSRGGQELIAHELTHVVQQGGASQIQRQLTDDLTPGQIEKMEEKGGALIQPKFHSISQTQTSTIQRAYTARRPLAGFIRGIGRMSRGGVIPNRGIFHEHIFFQDGGNPANIGFMDRNGLGQDNAGNYTIGHGRNNLDDPIMRQAVNDLGNPGQYSLLRNNCQMYVSNVYARYLELGGRAGT
ncbi:DUF4157 domain-containing protein [Aphanizomenon flos-aquae]|uniref:eCIS core domain-containing protein n=1 Tax=Aphanizomenon flos-aquae TaxID=1176 RepID=UPI001689C5C2|nr:DUF4157 domain-containing protein [Aphanizomenon flos-aquae]MBD2658024.1 DUF4157 domain-containing protein [Aphanizomenon flos-aquae FACHB-1265]